MIMVDQSAAVPGAGSSDILKLSERTNPVILTV